MSLFTGDDHQAECYRLHVGEFWKLTWNFISRQGGTPPVCYLLPKIKHFFFIQNNCAFHAQTYCFWATLAPKNQYFCIKLTAYFMRNQGGMCTHPPLRANEFCDWCFGIGTLINALFISTSDSDYILTISWLHYSYILAIFWLQSDYILTTFWLHSDYILAKF